MTDTPVPPLRPIRIGLTGGIGSGKSTVARLWVGLGARLVDTDQIARDLTRPGGAAMIDIRQLFGDALVADDGSLNRAAMRQLAFGDPALLQRLEGILHPLIGAEAQRQAAVAQACPEVSVVLFDVPLLVESTHWRNRVDRIVVVDCSEAAQVARVQARSGWPEDQVLAVMAKQATRAQRRQLADAVIFNDRGTLSMLAEQVEHLHRVWRTR